MSCHNPIPAWRSRDISDLSSGGKLKIVFREDLGFPNTRMDLPCGQCAGCRLDRARQWAIRCLHEASLHTENCFLTLTYAPDKLPPDGSLRKEDMVKFLKRLRKKYAQRTIRFFQCGEYGDDFGRPHHHCLIFGLDFLDKIPFSKSGENQLYISPTLNAIWGHGYCVIGALTFDSACYTARYILKKITGKGADEHYQGRTPEYVTMSRRPGIGREWYDHYKDDLYTTDKCIVRDGFVAKPPRYYDNLYHKEVPSHFEDIRFTRKQAALCNPNNTPDRRATIAECQNLKLQNLSRCYETL